MTQRSLLPYERYNLYRYRCIDIEYYTFCINKSNCKQFCLLWDSSRCKTTSPAHIYFCPNKKTNRGKFPVMFPSNITWEAEENDISVIGVLPISSRPVPPHLSESLSVGGVTRDASDLETDLQRLCRQRTGTYCWEAWQRACISCQTGTNTHTKHTHF